LQSTKKLIPKQKVQAPLYPLIYKVTFKIGFLTAN